MDHKIYIGTAGWALPPQVHDQFVGEGTNLEKYARFLNAAEINSSFYRDHKPETYRKWAASVTPDFRFAVKLNKYFTRDKKLTEAGDKLKETIDPILELEDKLGALLIQLPGKLEFNPKIAEKFFKELRHSYDGEVVLEPRSMSWVTRDAADILTSYSISKVLADPEPCRMPKRLRSQVEFMAYFRLHGSPEMYKSSYSPEILGRLAQQISNTYNSGSPVWCIFDNTTFGHALSNALDLNFMLENRTEAFNVEPSETHAAH